MGRGEVCTALVGKHKGMRSLGKPMRRVEHNIKMGLRGVGGVMDWIDLAQDTDR
jgi:hypothetical protein